MASENHGPEMKECPTCGSQLDKSAQKCPECGKEFGTSCGEKVIILIIIVAGLAIVGKVTDTNDSEKGGISPVDKVENSDIDSISARGNLYEVFSYMSEYTDVQRENAEKKVKGKVVKWRLKLYEVDRYEDYYKVQTSTDGAVDVFANIYPRNQKEASHIESLMTGDPITIKGRITGVSMRNIEMDPAVLSGNSRKLPSNSK